MRRQIALTAVLAAFGAGLALVPLTATGATPTTPGVSGATPARTACSPIGTPPEHTGAVPSPQQVLGYPLGSREATDADLVTYTDAVDAASDRVVTGTYARSWQGRPLRYALVGSPQTLGQLTQVQRDLGRIRDPQTSDDVASRLIARTPDVLWITANVHGNEPSGGDAVLELLYDLADRDDCVAQAILKNSVVGLIATQNPDGRANDLRTNGYTFDLNRDWFARTQPETSGKLDLLWDLPPQLYVDEHEMGGRLYFFPPNSDPIYHETPDPAYDEIQHLYGDANAAAFEAEGFRYETYQSGYDLFYQGYGDTVPTTQFGAAGMTFEQGGAASYPVKTLHHYTSALVSLYQGATHRAQVLRRWRGIFTTAQREGEQCRLEPNATFNPGNRVLRPVPDTPVCGYFLRDEGRETQIVLRRLQQAHVQVQRLTAPLDVPDYTPYGTTMPRATTLPAGTFWITLAQPQKHWVQAMLNNDTYVPFPYFYDVSGWSNPLLGGLDGGATGTRPQAALEDVPLLADPGPPSLSSRVPRIGVLDQRPSPDYRYQTTGWLQWRLDQDWRLPSTVLSPDQVTAASLRRLDVLLVPDVDTDPTYAELGASGRRALADWVAAGGRYVGWQGGTGLATQLGLSSVSQTQARASSPGALLSLNSPYPHTYALWESYDGQMSADGAAVVASFPADPFVSGYAEDADTLAGTAVEAVDRVGSGSATVFSVEPNFRGYTDATARLLLDAILATPTPDPSLTPTVPAPAGVPLQHTTADHLAHETAGRD